MEFVNCVNPYVFETLSEFSGILEFYEFLLNLQMVSCLGEIIGPSHVFFKLERNFMEFGNLLNLMEFANFHEFGEITGPDLIFFRRY